jgi:hypothetical protein
MSAPEMVAAIPEFHLRRPHRGLKNSLKENVR